MMLLKRNILKLNKTQELKQYINISKPDFDNKTSEKFIKNETRFT